MKITDKNIKFYIIKYLEGNLTIEQQSIFLEKVAKNEYFKNLLDTYYLTYNINDEENEEKHIENISEWENWCIRFFENELNENEKNTILKIIQYDLRKREVFEAYSLAKLKPKQEFFPKKNSLKKQKGINKTFEELCIEYIENLLSDNEKEEFEKTVLENKEKTKEFQLYLKTILKPDFTVKYKLKEKLKKKKTKKYVTLSWFASSAAFVIGFLFLLPNTINNYINKIPLVPHSKDLLAISRKANTQNIQSKVHLKQAIKTLPKYFIEQKNDSNNYETMTIYATSDTHQTQKLESLSNVFLISNRSAIDTFYDDIKLQEVLDKIFANHKFSYFHDFKFQSAEQQNKFTETNNNLWEAIKQGSKYFSNLTGADVKIQEYVRENSIKKEIAVGNLSFSRTKAK